MDLQKYWEGERDQVRVSDNLSDIVQARLAPNRKVGILPSWHKVASVQQCVGKGLTGRIRN